MSQNGGVVLFKKNDPGGVVLTDSKGKAKRVVSNNPEVDLIFVIDTTGSMYDKIDALLERSQELVTNLERQHVSWRAAIVAFGDLKVRGDTIQATGFSNKLSVVKHELANVPRNNGGGNNGESSFEALDKALALSSRQNAIKVFVLMTDDAAHKQTFTPDQIIRRLKQAGVLTFVISDPIGYYKKMATETAGKWFQISSETNFISILDELFRKVTETVVEVQTLGGGNVQTYLQLRSGK